MQYKLISKEHKISDSFSLYIYGIGGTDENDRIIVSYDDISADYELVKDLASLLEKHSRGVELNENVIENCLRCI